MTTPNDYKPRAGSKVAQAIELLQEGPLTQVALAELLEVDAKTMTARMESAVAHGVVSKLYVEGQLTYALKDAASSSTTSAPFDRVVADLSSSHIGDRAAPQSKVPEVDQPLMKRIQSASRFGVFSDGSLVIEHDGQTINLDQTLVGSLRSYLSRMDA